MTKFEKQVNLVFWTIIEICGVILIAQYFFGVAGDWMTAKNDLLVIAGIVGFVFSSLGALWLLIFIIRRSYLKFTSISQDHAKDQNVSPTA